MDAYPCQVGGVNASQTAVYEEFARSIPGFQPPAAGEAISTPPLPKPVQYEHGILGNAEVGWKIFLDSEILIVSSKDGFKVVWSNSSTSLWLILKHGRLGNCFRIEVTSSTKLVAA